MPDIKIVFRIWKSRTQQGVVIPIPHCYTAPPGRKPLLVQIQRVAAPGLWSRWGYRPSPKFIMAPNTINGRHRFFARRRPAKGDLLRGQPVDRGYMTSLLLQNQ